MCGIVGLMRQGDDRPDPAILDRMLAAVSHRGPDGEGCHFQGNTGLGQRRLAIIDLDGGRQPILAENGTAIVANGEIYNYRELYAAVPDASFSTQSDSELPLHLYLRHGLDYVDHLRGMYAIAIHDPLTSQLILSRDPFGIKPLYYAEARGYLLFASEPRALLASGLIDRQIEPAARDELLQLQFNTGRRTMWQGIRRLLPGETLVCREGRITDRRQRHALPPSGRKTIPAEAGMLDRILEESVALHQRSDVPYGLFLSGGIDSSILLAMMARLNTRPLRAYTVGFPDTRQHDERDLAETLARRVGADHVRVDFIEQDFWSLLPAVASALDDPTVDYACLPTFKLARTAASDLKVVLSGEGGDEIFAGYGRYRRAMRPAWLFGRAMRSSGALDGLDLWHTPPAAWRSGMADAERNAPQAGETRLQTVQRIDIADWLPNDLLTKLDRCLMAHGLEGRTPFLDTGPNGSGLSPFGFRLPDSDKIRNRLGKHVLRQWLSDHLPEAAPFSRKRGFTVPIGDWISRRGSELAPLVAKQPGISEFCKPDAVMNLFRHGTPRHGFAAWALLFYACWHQQHILGIPTANDTFALLAER